ncbi:MAG: hypothetical protein JWP82_1184 [Humibacillus sp.]|nr:hypothetical protein [Humibacillus sp.]
MGRTLLRLTGAMLLLVAVIALAAPRPVHTPLHQPWVVAGVVVLMAAALLVRLPRVLLRDDGARWTRVRVPTVVALAGGIVTVATGLGLRYPFGWDARVVMDLAATLDSGRPLGEAGVSYLSRYPNNLPLLVVDEWGHAVGRLLGVDPVDVLVVLGAVAVAITLYAVHDVVVHVAGRGPALGAQLATFALVAPSPWVAVPYTDVYALPFIAVAVALTARALAAPGRDRRRLVLVAGALLSTLVAYALKTTPVVVAVAIGLTIALVAWDRARPRRRRVAIVAVAAAGLAAFTGAALTVPSVAKVASGLGETRFIDGVTPTPLWWVANGAEQGVTVDGQPTYGSYSRQMVLAIAHLTPAETNAYASRFLADRWAERGLGGTLAFYTDKLAWNWGDGMFTAWGEGGDSLPGVLPPASGLVGVVHAVDGYHGGAYGLRSDLAQALWVALLLVAGVGLLRAPYRREVLLLAVTVLGIAAFTLLFQGRARYLFAYVPVVAALAGMVHRSLPRLPLLRPGSQLRPRHLRGR